MEPRETLVQQEQRVRVVLQERTVPLAPWAHEVCLVREDVPEPLELLAPVEMMVCPALLVHPGPWVLLELPVSQDPQEPREKLVLLVPVELKEHRDPEERLEPQDLPDLPEHLVTPVPMVSLVLKDLLVVLVLLELPDSPALVAPLDHRVQQDLWGPKDSLEIPVFPDSKVKLDLKESLAPPVPWEPQALQERKEREELVESLELLDHSDLQEREELLVTVVSPVRMVLLVPRVPLATVVFPVLLGLKVLLETPVAQESPAFLEPEVLLVVLEILVLKAKLDPLVLLVRTVVPALLVLRELVDSQV
ncbi:unnamed protein product [Ophioblennius macclurei]